MMRLVVGTLLGLATTTSVIAAPPGSSFGIAHKATWVDPSDPRPPGSWPGKSWPAHTEVQVFNHTCSCEAQAASCGCAMQHMWTGGAWDGYELSRIRYYIDGEAAASVDIPIGMGTGQPYGDDDGPWAAGVAFGKTGKPSGTYNTFAIPFQKTITVTVELLGSKPSNRFWIILRGRTIESGGSVAIPGTATWDLPVTARLRTVETSGGAMVPGQFLTLWNSTAPNTAVYLVVLQVESATGPTFLEGCFRILDAHDNVETLLSSGTEDYFGGTYYFNKGVYQNGLSGLTHGCSGMQGGCGANHTTFSAYRLHADDPLVVQGPEMHSETWRNGDPEGCNMNWNGAGAPHLTAASSFVMLYEW